MRGIYEDGFNGEGGMLPKKIVVNIYRKFSIAFALMSVIPFLVFFYVLTGRVASVDILVGDIGIVLAIAMFISLLGLLDLRKMYRVQEDSRKRIIQSAKLSSLGRLIAEVAHKVNNPLQVILGRARLALMRGHEDPEIDKNLRIIMEQCRRAGDVTHRLLLFSAPNTSEVGRSDLNHTIRTALKMIRSEYPRNDVKVEEKYTKRLPSILMDRHEICEVVMNLVKNSLDAMPNGGKIKVSTRKERGSVRVDIADTGIGIPEEDVDKLFDPFFSSKTEGWGVGLSICYGIIKAHDGDLSYSSVPGKGTVATMILPLNR
ncbi:sensor histidine kinase [Candidatus Omnitrophota bacterium]